MSCLIKNRKICSRSFVAVQKPLWIVLLFLIAFAKPTYSQPKPAESAEVFISLPGQTVMSAQWSPDAKTVAFTSDNYNGIWLADSNGTNIRILTTDQSVGFGFSWSPDGAYILGRSAITENRRRLHQIKIYDVRNASYEILVEKTRGINSLPVWSSTGTEVVFVRSGKMETVTWNKLQRTGLTPKSVLYSHLDKIFLFDEASKSSKEVGNFEGRVLFNLSPSPEGNKISFQVQGLGLYVMDANGENLISLGRGEKAAWLPGEKYVIVSVADDDGYNITGAELYAVDVNTGESYPLTANISHTTLKPAVSPNGKYVLFDSPEDGVIYRLALD